MANASTAAYERASPSLLSEQPPTPSKQPHADAEWPQERSSLEGRLVALRNWRQSWWTQNWSDIAEFLLPRRSIWLTQSTGGNPSPNNMTRGKPINTSIADPTATLALRVCAAGLMSGLASPSRPWFKIVPALKKIQLDAKAQDWMDETQERLYTVMAGSNFYSAFAQECEDLVAFGTAPSIIYEDEADLIRIYNPAVGEYYLASDATGRVNGLYRLFVMTMAQIVDFFGLEHCPKVVQDAWKEKGARLETEQLVAHAIEPNFGFGASNVGKIPGNFAWREVYWLWGQDGQGPLAKRGFVDQAFTAPRWSTQSNDAYGRGPGMDVLPDVMQLQVMTRRKAEAIEKQVRPPLVADMSLKNMPSSTLPGHVTYVQALTAGTGMRPIYEVQPDIRGMVEDITAIQNRIKVGFFNDLFLMLEQAPTAKMTAYEVAQKMQEKLQVVGPVIEGLLAESLKPKLKRIFNIMRRKGMIDPPPDSLKGVPLDIDFVSMLAMAQKASATGGLERLAGIIGNMAAIFPEAKDNLDPDAFIREYNDLLGNPEKILRGPEEVQQVRQQQAAAAQQQHNMAAISQAAEAAGKAAPAAQVLANVQTGAGQNALGQMLGG